LIEKPISGDVESAERIEKRARKAGVHLMVGHIERFNPAVSKIKQLIDEGALGRIVSISSKRVGPYVNVQSYVGVCLDLAIHDIDVMRFITEDEVCEVYAKAGKSLSPNEDSASILLTMLKGATGLIETNWLTPTKIRRLDVTGIQGFAAVDYITQDLFLYGKMLSRDLADYEELKIMNGQPYLAKMKIVKEEPLKLELTHFINCVLANQVPIVSGRVGIRNLEIVLAAIRSAKEGQPVSCGTNCIRSS
jgi:UDP-N-acetylglucosamine 3-dehydrogenase